MTSIGGLYATLKAVYYQTSALANNMTSFRDFKFSESLENLDHSVRTEHFTGDNREPADEFNRKVFKPNMLMDV